MKRNSHKGDRKLQARSVGRRTKGFNCDWPFVPFELAKTETDAGILTMMGNIIFPQVIII